MGVPFLNFSTLFVCPVVVLCLWTPKFLCLFVFMFVGLCARTFKLLQIFVYLFVGFYVRTPINAIVGAKISEFLLIWFFEIVSQKICLVNFHNHHYITKQSTEFDKY